ncbi:MAG TPA: hypothetical protein VK450_06295, partial [Methanomicrobiales archaeon]|nr:hypothetical protein [Methanomicrobiales archaeon]
GIRCLLLSAHVTPGGHAAARAARDCGVPVISWQHGGAGYCYHPMMPYLEFLHSDVHLVFGDGAAAGYRATAGRLGLERSPRFIPVGSSTLDQVRKTPGGWRVPAPAPVVYITTSFLERKFYFISQGFDPVSWDEHLWSVQQGVIRLAQAHANRPFIVKLHPSHTSQEPIRSLMADNGVDNARIVVREQSIPDLARGSAAVLLDHVTTGILEAALFPVPIFVYTGLGGIEEPALTLLRRRAHCFGTLGEFLAGVEQFLAGKPGGANGNPADDRFLEAYGTFLDDGGSAGRAARVVRETLAGRTNPAVTSRRG